MKMEIFHNNLFYNIIGLIVAIIVVIIVYFKWIFTYWKRKGLYGPEPSIMFGNIKGWILQKISIGEQFDEFYQHLKAKGLKHGGIYLTVLPCYIPVDIEIVKNILQRDFQHFVNHGVYINEKVDPLSGHLFKLEDDKWKRLRTILTPSFASSKLKIMFQIMVDCTKEMNRTLHKNAVSKNPVDIKDVTARFSINIIGSCAFGIDCDCFKDVDNDFRKYGKRALEHTPIESLQATIEFFFPKSVLTFFNFKSNKTDVEKFFMKIVRDTVNYREKNNIYRNDFLQSLIQLKNQHKLGDNILSDMDNTGLTLNELTAQCFVFFVAGYETSAKSMSFTLFELTKNLEIQNKVREEINRVLKEYDGSITYEACMEMTYLEKVINESLRKYPSTSVLFRMCNKDYKVPNSNICIEKGTYVMIPALSIHYDPDYYPNPHKFDPERFNEENKSNRPGCTFLPFGEGPRICIGLRFGMLQMKIGLITILKNYKVTLNQRTTLPLKFTPKGFLFDTENKIWLNFEKLM